MMAETQGNRDVQIPEHKVQPSEQQVHLNPTPPSATSLSHDFSFTISIHNQTNSPTPPNPPPPALDLSPADDIFLNGQLLPLRFLSHLPPRPAAHNHTKSIDQYTFNPTKISQNFPTESKSKSNPESRSKSKSKSYSFSLFKIAPKSTKEVDSKSNYSIHLDKGTVKKSKLEAVKKFLRSIRLIKSEPINTLRSGRGDYVSAPVTGWNSPKNSGVLVGSGTVTPTKSSDSTMEELQAAIQAAIAHCKNSTAA